VTETGGTSGVVDTGGAVAPGGAENGGSAVIGGVIATGGVPGGAGVTAPVETGGAVVTGELRSPAAQVARRLRRKPARRAAAAPVGLPGARPRVPPGSPCSGFWCSPSGCADGASASASVFRFSGGQAARLRGNLRLGQTSGSR